MSVCPDHPVRPAPDSADARAASLIAVAEDLAGEFSLRPLLERILRRCTELLGCDAGSICSVDEAAGTYRKEADIGVACQSGQVFPLTEGMTGTVVARRAAVWFDRYDDVRGGHVAAGERARLRGVIGVPLEWRGRIIGACVVFSRDERRVFGPADAELLQLFAKHAAIALANARMHEAAEERARAEAAAAEREHLLGELHDTLSERLVLVRAHLDSAAGDLAGSDPGVAEHLRHASDAARDALIEARLALLGLAAATADGRPLDAALRAEAGWAQSIGGFEVKVMTAGQPAGLDEQVARAVLWVAREVLTNIVRHAGASAVRVGLLYERGAVSLLIQDDGEGFDAKSGWAGDGLGLRPMTDRVRELGGTAEVDSLPGWGTRIRARFPCQREHDRTAPRLRVLVAAGSPVLRAGLARLLSWAEPGIEVVGEVASAEEALAACAALRPDVTVADLELPAGDSDVTSLLLGAQPDLAVVGLCEVTADEAVARAVKAGARGCVDIGASGPELAQAVVAAAHGQAILSRAVLRQLHRGMRTEDLVQPLTGREREVRGLMEQGLTDRVIAQRLVLSVKTVEKHAGAVLRKTGARNRTELASRARHR